MAKEKYEVYKSQKVTLQKEFQGRSARKNLEA